MLVESTLLLASIFGFALSGVAQEEPKSKPIELEVLTGSIGVWDAEFEVWPEGSDSSSVKFKGMETNRPYGEYWISSNVESEFMCQITKVHSVVGYDLDRQKLVGTVVDHGPYAASMTGEYDNDSKTVILMTEAKDPNGKPMVQRTTITQVGADERLLVLSVPGKNQDEFTKFMQIRFVRRK